MRSWKVIAFFLIALGALGSSCQTVKPYQRVYLNDFEMRPGYPGGRAYEEYVLFIREAASGGGSNKTSGGCGCN